MLTCFAEVRPKVAEYVDASRDYRASTYELPEDLRRRIAQQWGEYIRRYGYEEQAVGCGHA